MQELLSGHLDRMYDLFRMDGHVFLRLCDTLQELDLVRNERKVGVHEVVVIRLFIVSHSSRMCVVADRFQHSNETIHRQFYCVLRAICSLTPHIICPRNRGETPRNNPKYYPYFKVRIYS